MTTDELKQEAEEYALEKCKECYMCNSEENGERLYCAKFESRKEGYIAGAEPREKRIAELEKENADLKEEVNKIAFARGNLEEENAELEKQLDIVRNERNLFQERSEDILENYYCDHKCKCTELEKENAELKVSCKIQVDTAFQMIYEKDDQLTKAKDLLKKVADVCGYPNYDIPVELYADIEHFISEVEK